MLGQLRAAACHLRSFLCFCCSFVFLQEMWLVVGDRKGGEPGRTEVSWPFIGILVKVPFEKLPQGLGVPWERWDFSTCWQTAGLCPLEERSGRGGGKQETRNQIQKQTSSLLKVLDQLTERPISIKRLARFHSEQESWREASISWQQETKKQTSEPDQQPRLTTAWREGPGGSIHQRCAKLYCESPLSHGERKHS